jgi:hypothetical protein
MNFPTEIKDVLDLLTEFQQLALEDASLTAFNPELQIQHLRAAYTFSNAVASLKVMYLPNMLVNPLDPSQNKQTILHICLIQQLLTSIQLLSEQGKFIDDKTNALFCASLQQAIDCYQSAA